jgi:uncharacterized protein (TIGR00369 family)
MLGALMEEASCAAIAGTLPEGKTSVGISLNMQHLKPSRIGADVRAVAKTVEQKGRKIVLSIEAYEGDKVIGRADHTRAIVDAGFGE